MSTDKPWRPRMRGEPMLNPFEPSTEWTRDLGANERIEVPIEDEAASEDQVKPKDGESPPK